MRKGGNVRFNKNGTELDIWIYYNGKRHWHGVSISQLNTFLDNDNQKEIELYSEYDDGDNPFYIPPMHNTSFPDSFPSPLCHYCKKGPTVDAPLFPIATVGTYYMHVPSCEANKDQIMPDGKPMHHDASFCECEFHTKGSPTPDCAKCNPQNDKVQS
jgi:hypothetical protein